MIPFLIERVSCNSKEITSLKEKKPAMCRDSFVPEMFVSKCLSNSMDV